MDENNCMKVFKKSSIYLNKQKIIIDKHRIAMITFVQKYL
jgi:hypothetical protein